MRSLAVASLTGVLAAFAAGSTGHAASPAAPSAAVVDASGMTLVQGRRPVICTMEYRPVCATRRGRAQTYSNACHAERAGARILHRGECRAAQPRYRERPWDWWLRGCFQAGGFWVCRW